MPSSENGSRSSGKWSRRASPGGRAQGRGRERWRWRERRVAVGVAALGVAVACALAVLVAPSFAWAGTFTALSCHDMTGAAIGTRGGASDRRLVATSPSAMAAPAVGVERLACRWVRIRPRTTSTATAMR